MALRSLCAVRAVSAMHVMRAVLVVSLAVSLAPDVAAQPAAPSVPAWANDYLARVTALALLQTFNAELLSHDSATLTLERWCGAHNLATPAKIVAVRDSATTKPAAAEHRKALGVNDREPIRYRRVKLTCGARV